MADSSARFVRFLNADRRSFGWWHLHAGGDLTRCAIRIQAAKAPQFAEFSDRADGEVCTRCQPVH